MIDSVTTNGPPQPFAAVHWEGDLIVNLQSVDLNSNTSVWTNRTSNSRSTGNFTTVGSAGPLSASYWGTFDQSGNVAEHNDTPTQFGQDTRVIRGGHYNSFSDAISAEVRGYCPGCYVGLRVASVLNPNLPNPNGGLVAYWNAENGATAQ